LTWKTDEEVTALFNGFSDKERSRVAITRWRNKSRHPKYEERIEIENKLGVPFEVFHKDVDFDALIAKLEGQLIEVHKLKTEKEVRAKMSGK
jgi:hypothetical protein